MGRRGSIQERARTLCPGGTAIGEPPGFNPGGVCVRRCIRRETQTTQTNTPTLRHGTGASRPRTQPRHRFLLRRRRSFLRPSRLSGRECPATPRSPVEESPSPRRSPRSVRATQPSRPRAFPCDLRTQHPSREPQTSRRASQPSRRATQPPRLEIRPSRRASLRNRIASQPSREETRPSARASQPPRVASQPSRGE